MLFPAVVTPGESENGGVGRRSQLEERKLAICAPMKVGKPGWSNLTVES